MYRLLKFIFLFLIKNKILTLILIVGVLLRFIGVYPGFPYFHSDEPMVYRNAAKIITEHRFLPDVYAYPTLLPLLHAVLYLLIFIPLTIIKTFLTGQSVFNFTSLDFYIRDAIFGYQEINALYWSRYINAFLGSISILVAYYIAKRIFNKKAGLISATLLAVNYRHVLGSHYALVDVANGLFLLLSLIASLEVLKSDDRKTYIFSGIISGLSASIKYNPWGILMVFIAHLYKFKPKISKSWASKLIYMLLFFLLTLIIISPFHFINYQETQKYLEYLQFKYDTGKIHLLPYPFIYLFNIGLGQIISILALVGILISLRLRFKETLIILITLILFFAALTIYSSGGIYVRNFGGVTPFLLIFASLPLSFFLEFLKRKWKELGIIFFILVLAIIIFPQAKNSYIVARDYSKEWNLTKAKRELSYLKGKKIAGDTWFLDQIFAKGEISKIDYNIKTNFTFPELQEAGAEYLVLDTGSIERFFTWWMKFSDSKVLDQKRKVILYKSFSGSVVQELVDRRDQEFVKDWPAYENNIFIIPIPKKDNSYKANAILEEDFEKQNALDSDQLVEFPSKKPVKVIDNEQKCLNKSCLWIEGYLNQDPDYRLSGEIPLFSKAIKVDQGYLYKVSVKINYSQDLENNQSDGVIKVRLYRDLNEISKRGSENVVFVSSRYSSAESDWQEKELMVDIPTNFRYMVVYFQSDGNSGNQFYIDNLKIEKSAQKSFGGVKRKRFPEEIVFINSII